MNSFVYEALSSRVVFGFGTLAGLAEEVRRLGCSRALVLTTAAQRNRGEEIVTQLGDLAAGLYSNATMHTPVEVTRDALMLTQELEVDCLIALGGGSTIGLSKAIALHTDLPQIVIPTTYAGSEATPIIGQTENGLKTTQRTLRVLPEVILYDVDLSLTLPLQMTVTSAMNAIAHAVEALYSKDANPLISTLAEQGIAALARALPRLTSDLTDKEARSDALFGGWACGVCLGSVGMSIHHKLCHTLGGSFGLPHAETHTVVLPHAVAYNAAAAPEAMARIAKALGVSDAAQGLFDLAYVNGGPTRLADIGMDEADLPRAVELACSSPYWNPRPIEPDAIRHLLDNAFKGVRPSN